MWRRSVCKRADSKMGALHCIFIQAHALTTHLSPYRTCGVAVSASALTLDWALFIANVYKHTTRLSLHTAYVTSQCLRAR